MYNFDAICDGVLDLKMFRGDANDAIYARHLVQETLSKLFVQEYPRTKWASGELINIDTSVDDGAREFSYFETGQAGEASIVADNATDIPTATITGDLTVHKVHTVATSFYYSTQDVRQSRLQKMFDITTQKADSARETHDRKINNLIRSGEGSAGLEGFTNHSGIIVQSAATGGWLTATATQIVSDFSTAASFIMNNSGGVEEPNMAVMPLDIYTRLSTLQNSVASDITVLEYLQKAWPEITFTWEEGMRTAGAGGTPAVMIYDKNPAKAQAVMPMVLRPMAPEQHGLVFKVVLESRFGGVMTPRPLSALRLDGV